MNPYFRQKRDFAEASKPKTGPPAGSFASSCAALSGLSLLDAAGPFHLDSKGRYAMVFETIGPLQTAQLAFAAEPKPAKAVRGKIIATMHSKNSGSTSNHVHIAVVGGGITGLTAGFRLLRTHRVKDFLVLEAAGRTGGNIDTLKEDGLQIEHGPNGFLDNVPETLELVEDLGLKPLPSNDAARKRFLLSRGRLVRVPTGPLGFLASPLLSFPGRLRVLAEPFGPKPPPGDETVFSFASRRIGREAASVLVDSMVTGVFAGDSKVLSLKSAFPKMADMERKYGSLVKALLFKMWHRATGHRDALRGGPSGPGGVLTSFACGMSELVGKLGQELGGRILTGSRVTDIARKHRKFLLTTTKGRISADKVLLAIPAPQAAEILYELSPAVSGLLRSIPTAPIAVVAFSFDKKRFPDPLDGFGFLVPKREGLRLLGSLWTSSIFQYRAPEESVLVRNMAGGLRDPLAVTLPDEALKRTIFKELQAILGPLPDPQKAKVFRYPQGISQYPPGHGERLKAIRKVLSTIPGLYAAGNSFEGISVNLCVVQANRAAEKLAGSSGRTPVQTS